MKKLSYIQGTIQLLIIDINQGEPERGKKVEVEISTISILIEEGVRVQWTHMGITDIDRVVEHHISIMIEVVIIVEKEGVDITIEEIEVKAEINIDLVIGMVSTRPLKISVILTIKCNQDPLEEDQDQIQAILLTVNTFIQVGMKNKKVLSKQIGLPNISFRVLQTLIQLE